MIRRVLTLSQQGELLPTWEHFAFATNRTDDLATVEAEHRQHAVVELHSAQIEAKRSSQQRPGMALGTAITLAPPSKRRRRLTS
ncbi:MAG: hypothetical protein WKF94_07680 [Solirubrobacteraceae bacterium]